MIACNKSHPTVAAVVALLAAGPAFGQPPPAADPPPVVAPTAPSAPASPTTMAAPVIPADYVVGPEDLLTIMFWRERDMSGDVLVRPDGKISLPLLNDIDVAGLTPAEVRDRVTEAARKFIEEPNATVVVKQINSRKVYITGSVERPGTYPLLRSMTILQLIAQAGGLREFAKAGDIVVVRNEGGRQLSYPFSYDDLKSRKNLSQNILLKPGDTVIVP